MHKVIRNPVMKFHYITDLLRLLPTTTINFYSKNYIILYDLLLECWLFADDDADFYLGYSISAIRLLTHCTNACIVIRKLASVLTSDY